MKIDTTELRKYMKWKLKRDKDCGILSTSLFNDTYKVALKNIENLQKYMKEDSYNA